MEPIERAAAGDAAGHPSTTTLCARLLQASRQNKTDLSQRKVSMRLTCSRAMVVLLTAAILGSSGVIAGHRPGPAASASSVVDLLDGSFTLTTSDGDIAGVYTGSSSVSPSGRTEASLDLQVTSGTNSFQGATGRLMGDGAGAFTGEGSFSLTLRGSI